MRDRRDRRGRLQHPRKREAEPRERKAIDVNENTERDQWSKEARARLKEARKIGASGDGHFFRIEKSKRPRNGGQTTAYRITRRMQPIRTQDRRATGSAL